MKNSFITILSAIYIFQLITIHNARPSDAFSTKPPIANTLPSKKATTISNKCRQQLIAGMAVNSETDEISTEGFGVGEKSLGMKDFIQSEDETVSSSSISDNKDAKDAMEPLMVKTADDDREKAIVSEKNNVPSLTPKAVLRFIAPTLALWIAPPVMSLIDTSVVGRFCGPTDLAALSPGCVLIDSSSYLFFFLATASTNMVAAAIANDEDPERIVSEALFLALCSGAFLAALVFVAGGPLLLAIAGKASASVVPSALKYSIVRAFGQPFVIMASVARAAALAEKDTRGPLVSVAIAFMLNVVGTLTLVKKTSLGITGAAVGTLCADIATTLFLLGRIRKSRQVNAKETNEPRTPLIVIPSMENLRRFLIYAAPIFFTILGKSVVYNGVAMSVGRLGSVALAAHQVLLRNFFFWCPVGDSVGMTSQVFLPGILAEENKTGVPNQGAKRLLFATGILSGVVAATLAALLPTVGSALFTKDIDVAAAIRRVAPILAFSISNHAIALTCEGMLLAQRDLSFLKSSYIITTIATLGLLLSPLRPATLGGSWWILAMFQCSRSIQFAFRNVVLNKRRRREQAIKS